MSGRDSLSHQQFPPYTGGPAEARAAVNPPRESLYNKPQGEQGRLFDPKSVAMPEAHTQTPEQFARDPRTWFHGRFTAERSRLGSGQGREGFHAGSEGAARQRLKANVGRRAAKEGVGGHLFPLRITGPVSGPEEMQPDVTAHTRLGVQSMWSSQPKPPIPGGGYLYENVVESPGSISVGVPRRKGFLSTQREMVSAAQQEGKKVHPLIAWAAKKAPEHTGETYPAQRPMTPEGQRYAPRMLQEHLEPSQGYQIASQMYPSTDKMERTSYQTQGGKMQHAWRYREPGPGSALLSKQWSPAN